MWFRRRPPTKPLRETDPEYTKKEGADSAPNLPRRVNLAGSSARISPLRSTQLGGPAPEKPAQRHSSPRFHQALPQIPTQIEPLLFEVDPTLSSWLWAAAQTRDLSPEALVAELLLRGLEQQAQRDRIETVLTALTPRECEVVQLAARGLTNQQIAEALVISPETVKTHVRHALEKLGLHSKVDLRLLLREGKIRWWKRSE